MADLGLNSSLVDLIIIQKVTVENMKNEIIIHIYIYERFDKIRDAAQNKTTKEVIKKLIHFKKLLDRFLIIIIDLLICNVLLIIL